MSVIVHHYMKQPGLEIVAYDDRARHAVWDVRDGEPTPLEARVRTVAAVASATLTEVVDRVPGAELRAGEHSFTRYVDGPSELAAIGRPIQR